jgi:sortase (surface protein transpeptidase)
MHITKILVLLTLLAGTWLLAGCGQQAAGSELEQAAASQQPTIQPTVTAEPTPPPTATPEPTLPPPTATPEPTLPPPTATPEPTQPPPTATPEPTAVPQTSARPSRIVINQIAMDQPLVSVGLDANGYPIVPNHDAAWYNLSAQPGEGENVVLWGHVLRFQYAPDIPAPFGRVEELTLGAPITLYDANGEAHTYVVSDQIWALPHEVEHILPQGYERLTMVSCIGERVVVNGSVANMSHRLITIATPE